MKTPMRAALGLVVSLFLLSGLAIAQSSSDTSQQSAGQEHHSRFSKMAIWRHHKDKKSAKETNVKPVAQQQPVHQAQLAPTAPRPVKHISDFDNDDKAPAKTAKAQPHPATPGKAHVQLASSKQPVSAKSAKTHVAVHPAAKKTAEPGASAHAHAKTAQKKPVSGKKAAAKDEKKPA